MSILEVHETVAEVTEVCAQARRDGARVGLVPTMGALHAGHRFLVERAVAECDVVVVSIFANPLQFGDPEDLAGYPRTLDADLATCQEAGATVAFVPTVAEMYPSWPEAPRTSVTVGGVSEGLEGGSRPGHFAGVATVVAKLLAMVGSCRAYFGEKDFQQLAVVRALVADLSFPVEVVGCATVRDVDGLALSSRNVRLTPPDRAAAACIPRALQAGWELAGSGEDRPEAIEEAVRAVLSGEPRVLPDYVAVRHADDLSAPVLLDPDRPSRLLVAAAVGGVRLLDNCALEGAPWVPIPGEGELVGPAGGGR